MSRPLHSCALILLPIQISFFYLIFLLLYWRVRQISSSFIQLRCIYYIVWPSHYPDLTSAVVVVLPAVAAERVVVGLRFFRIVVVSFRFPPLVLLSGTASAIHRCCSLLCMLVDDIDHSSSSVVYEIIAADGGGLRFFLTFYMDFSTSLSIYDNNVRRGGGGRLGWMNDWLTGLDVNSGAVDTKKVWHIEHYFIVIRVTTREFPSTSSSSSSTLCGLRFTIIICRISCTITLHFIVLMPMMIGCGLPHRGGSFILFR